MSVIPVLLLVPDFCVLLPCFCMFFVVEISSCGGVKLAILDFWFRCVESESHRHGVLVALGRNTRRSSVGD